jgi:hypothetical protein
MSENRIAFCSTKVRYDERHVFGLAAAFLLYLMKTNTECDFSYKVIYRVIHIKPTQNIKYFHVTVWHFYIAVLLRDNKIKFTLEQAVKAQKGSGCIALLFL